MKDPDRLLLDPSAPRELQALLRRAPRARALDPAARERGRLRALHLVAPVTLLTGLSVSTSAIALSAVTGALAGAVTIGAVVLARPLLERPSEPAVTARAASARAVVRVPRPPAPVVPAAPAPPAALDSAQTGAMARAPRSSERGAAPPDASQSLAAESRLLELARRALQADPMEALALAREHERRFDRPRLAAERTLIGIEALYRLDRHAEARALAEQWLARGADDLYRERVQRLLEKID